MDRRTRDGASTRERPSEVEGLAAVVDALPDGVLAYDAAGAICLANVSARRLLGLPPDGQVIGLRHSDLVALLAPRFAEDTASAALGPGARPGAEAELKLVNPSCSLRLLRPRLPRSQGQPFASLIVLQDRTSVKADEQLHPDWLHTVAHDLRTPLTNVKAYTQLALRQVRRLSQVCRAEEAATFERTVAHLETVERQAERLAALVLSLSEAASSPKSGADRQ